MTGAKFITSGLPPKVTPDEKIPWEVKLRTVKDGTNHNYIGGAIFERPVKNGDSPVNGAVFILTDKQGNPVKIPPGKRISGMVPVDPLTSWMTTVPSKLEWTAVVGWLEKTGEKKWGLHATDRKDHTVTVVKKAPGIIDWIKDNPEIVAAGTAGAVGLTYVATR